MDMECQQKNRGRKGPVGLRSSWVPMKYQEHKQGLMSARWNHSQTVMCSYHQVMQYSTGNWRNWRVNCNWAQALASLPSPWDVTKSFTYFMPQRVGCFVQDFAAYRVNQYRMRVKMNPSPGLHSTHNTSTAVVAEMELNTRKPAIYGIYFTLACL